MGTSTNSVETVAIVDLGNDIQFTYNVSGYVYTLNKLSLRLKQTDKFVFITNADGFNNSPDNQVIRLDYTIVSSPVYASNDLLLAGLSSMIASVSLGGGGGAGGGNNTWSTSQGDFTSTPTVATTNITIAGLSWVFDWYNVAIVTRQNSSGDVKSLKISNVSVAAGVITLGDEDNFAAGDTVAVTLIGPDKGYDEAIDSQIVSVINPDSAKWTSPEHLVDFSAQGADTLRYIIPMEGFTQLSMHWRFVNSNAGDTITMTLWTTNNAAADDTADTNWVDVSGDKLTKTLTITNGTIEFLEELINLNPLKMMVKIVVVSAAATNAADIYIKKLYA